MDPTDSLIFLKNETHFLELIEPNDLFFLNTNINKNPIEPNNVIKNRTISGFHNTKKNRITKKTRISVINSKCIYSYCNFLYFVLNISYNFSCIF